MKTKIDISAAIAQRKQEIKKLTALRPKIQKLIDDSEAAGYGKPCMSRREWESLKKSVESELIELGVVYLAHGVIPQLNSWVGLPTHWSQAVVA